MRSSRSVAILLLGLGTAWAQDPAPTAPASPAFATAGSANPHGDSAACATCHGAETTQLLPIVATCKTCHPDADHHPDSMVPPDSITVAAGWPLEEGKVTCATCHVEPAHEGLAGVATPYLRGGPYAQGSDFCYSCHGRTAVTRSDPHHPGSWYAADDPSCGACHSGIPDRNAAPEQSLLRLGPDKVCTTCHPGTQHWGMPLHDGKVVPEAVRATLPPEIALLAAGTIGCFSCHDVHAGHDAGTVSDSPLARGLRGTALAEAWADIPADAVFPGAHPEHSPMLARRLEDSELCASCHGDGP